MIHICNVPRYQAPSTQELREMRENHLMLQRSTYHTCRNCGQLEYAVLDNIDPYREALLNKILK